MKKRSWQQTGSSWSAALNSGGDLAVLTSYFFSFTSVTGEPPGGPESGLGERAFQQASMSMSVFDTEQRYLRLNDVAVPSINGPTADDKSFG